MPIRLSGINSGLDTDALVKELVSAYSLKKEKYQKEQTKIEWKQDAWKTLNTKETDADGGGNQGTSQQQQAQIKKAVEEINRRANNSEAVFGVHEDTNRVTIKIVDKQTKEIIKEFPPDKTLDMIARVWEMAGLMVDEKR